MFFTTGLVRMCQQGKKPQGLQRRLQESETTVKNPNGAQATTQDGSPYMRNDEHYRAQEPEARKQNDNWDDEQRGP